MRAAAVPPAGAARPEGTPAGAGAAIDGGRGGALGGTGSTAGAGGADADSFADAGSGGDAPLQPFSSALATAQKQSSATAARTDAASTASDGSGAVKKSQSASSAKSAAVGTPPGRTAGRVRSGADASPLNTVLQYRAGTPSTASANTRVEISTADAADADSAATGSAGANLTSAAALSTAMSAAAVDASLADAAAVPTASTAENVDAGTHAGGRAGKRDAGSDSTSMEPGSDAALAALALLFGANGAAVAAASAASAAGGSAAAPGADDNGAGTTVAAAGARSHAASNAGRMQLALDSDGREPPPSLSPTTLELNNSATAALASGLGSGSANGGSGDARSAGDASAGAAGSGTGDTSGTSGSGSPAGSSLVGLLQNLTPVPGATTSAPAMSTLALPVSDPSWPHALAAQVQWLATRQMQSATLRLTPEHLGPLEVRIEVAHSQVNVNFSAHHAETRDALAQAVPRLRELFNASGLSLGQATVGQQAHSGERSTSPGGATHERSHETVEPVANATVHRLGLIDEYA